MTFAEAIREAMREEMRRCPDVYLLGEDIGVYRGSFGVTDLLYREFPDRVIDTPISEAAFTGAAVGMALKGLRPVVEIMFSDFISVCYDLLLNQASKMRFMFGGTMSVPMVLRTAAGCGTGAAAQHSQSLEAMLCHIPGLKVVMPSNPADAKGLMKTAIRDNDPVIFLEDKLLYKTKGTVPEGDVTVPIGKAAVLREGDYCTVVTYGRMTSFCLEAAEILSREGKEIEVVDLRTLLPMDTDTVLESVRKTGRLVAVHEAVKTGGLGGEIISRVCESDVFAALKSAPVRLGAEDIPVPFSPVLETAAVPDVKKICDAIRNMKHDAKK